MANSAPTHLVHEVATSIRQVEPGVFLVDFGRVAFGNLQLTASDNAGDRVTVRFGEALSRGRVDRKPPGTVRYKETRVTLKGATPRIVAPRADERNTAPGNSDHPPAILTPTEWDVVLPFRWVEIEGWPGEVLPEQVIRRAAYASTWNDDAARFNSSDNLLNRVWELSRHSIKATTFAGIYVDGDRERIPYEADAYLNQISHYATDDDIQMARDTFDHLMQHGTWPTEWAPHMVFMAFADWMHTGDREWLRPRYQALKNKLLLERAGADGLITSNNEQIKKGDIVDWPPGERDGYVFTRVNTVVNAFHLKSLALMSQLSVAVGNTADATHYAAIYKDAHAAFQKKLFLAQTGRYRDGLETGHSSLHANLFPLAFGLVPEENRDALAAWLANRGMACSVYAAQYLLEGLFENGAGEQALALITAPGNRSWRHMVDSGATITWEAWDMRYKPNQDWNHAWGAAPANLLPRYILGARPHAPGWATAHISPVTGSLAYASGKVPTPRGPILIDWKASKGFVLSLALPEGMAALVDLPAPPGSTGVMLDGMPTAANHIDGRWVLAKKVTGNVVVEVI